MKHRVLRVFLIAGAFWSAANARAGFYTPVMPQDLSRLEVSLITVGYSEELYQLWGHTGIRLRDPSSQTDVVAAWGYFDFDAPNFGLNFFRGILTYRFGFQSYEETVKTYVMERRSLWIDRLNLTPVQKERLMKRLIWHAQPENRPYRYNYFFDNCSTRPRDYINEALGGAFLARFGKGLSDSSFRDMVRQHMAIQPFFGMSLDVLMNSNLDRPMTVWEEMFLPLGLRKYLSQMPAIDDTGQPRLGEALLSDGRQVLDYKAPILPLYTGFHLVVIPFSIAMCLALACAAIRTGAAQSLFWRLLGLTSWGWGGLFGTFGLVMLLGWLFSEHQDLLHNANLWFFWPTDLPLLAWLGWRWIWRAKQGLAQGRIEKLVLFYSAAHLVAFAMAVIFSFLGVLNQDFQPIATFFGPLLVFFWGMLFRRVGMPSLVGQPVNLLSREQAA